MNRFRYKATKASMAQSKLKQIERMEEVKSPLSADDKTFHIKLEPRIESSLEVMEIKNLQFGYSKPFGEIGLRITQGERVGIIGGNGTGKSTLLKTLIGALMPLSGKIKFGQNVEIGYFDQQVASSRRGEQTVLEDYLSAFPGLDVSEARTDLGAFMFSKDDVFKTLSNLSGGELVRLELCKVFKSKPNLLVLDEPTNHMDILSKERLEEILIGFKGTIIFVSHDRYFVNKLATSLIVFEEEGVKVLKDTTYSSYINSFKKKTVEVILEEKEIKQLVPVKKEASSYKQNKEHNKLIIKLERDINRKEEKIRALNDEYNNPEIMSNAEKLMEISLEIEREKQALDSLMEKWLELNN